MNVMIVVPHPDDEVLGFGGVIQKHKKAGDKVFVNFMAEIRSPRLEKQYSQSPMIGKKLVNVSEFQEVKLTDDEFLPNVVRLEDDITEFKPDIIYTVFGGDNHQDHEYIFKMIRVATRIWGPFLVKKIYLGEVLSSTDQAPRLSQHAFIPTYYVPLTKKEVNKKIECMKRYSGEIQKWPHPRSEKGIFNLAERRGSECGCEYAESFMILRHIEDV